MNELKFWARVLMVGCLLGGLSFFSVMQFGVKGGTVTMPDLKGLPKQAAAHKLESLGLIMQVREERYSNTAPFGAVLEQSMEAGSSLKKGRAIALVVSIGNKTLNVPMVVGSPTARQAQLLLEQNGLSLARLAYIASELPKETVLAQSPQVGTQAARGEGVSLLVSTGPRIPERLMPDLKGWNGDEARRLVGRMGLILRQVSEVQAADVPPGSVVAQSLTPSTRVSPGLELNLQVSPGGGASTPARLATLEYKVPTDAMQERRLRLIVRDAMGERVVHNRMEQPGASIVKEAKVYGSATLEVTLGGQVVETSEIP